MSYLVLARKYRPQTFKDIVGQSHVWKVLRNAIKSDRLAHAYIFSGPRGTGKTTTARVFSKALNCEIKNDEPCNGCAFCKEIMDGKSVDIIEIDGASNRGIDEIRALRENVRYAPASLKYKIYIIDEAHQITKEGFNALLKTLEEPPEHVVFILATTELNKVPSTILSRCQRFKFRALSTVEIAAHLKDIIKREKFNVQDSAAGLIAAAANGSLRDSLSILDQIVSFSPKETITDQTVRELLGLTPIETVESLFELAAKNDSRGLLNKIVRVADEGYDFIQVSRDLRDRLRNLLVINYIGDEKNIGAHYLPEELESLKKQKDLLDTSVLMRGFHLMNKCLDEIRWSDTPRLVFELYALKIASGAPSIDELIRKVEELEENLGGSGSAAGTLTGRKTGISAPASGELFRAAQPAASYYSAPQTQQTQKISPAQQPVTRQPQNSSAPAASVSVKDIESAWAAALNEIRKKKPLVAGFLDTCKGKKLAGNQLIISMGAGLGVKTINSNLNYLIIPALNKAFGRQLKVVIDDAGSLDALAAPVEPPAALAAENPGNFEAIDPAAEELSQQEEAAPSAVEEPAPETETAPLKETQDEVIKKIVKTFSGKIIKDGTLTKNPAPDRRIP